ncbi:signal recognition particle, SRP9/SRP14 subunit [Mrakia frigida]|uniref:signal recognition particle 14 kDa protein n=1 Tax=Mrakia frigida TaxID=29902 RepID=UPI003FCBF957
MPSTTVSNDDFLVRLQSLLDKNKTLGSVWITQKRLTYTPTPAEEEEAQLNEDVDMGEGSSSLLSEKEWPCVVKASDGEIKFSTQISPSDLPSFTLAYGTLLKASLAPHLKKRDKKKEKARAEDIVKEKKKLEAILAAGVGEEGKRGKGRSRRQKRIKSVQKAQLKLDALVAKEDRKKKVAGTAVVPPPTEVV